VILLSRHGCSQQGATAPTSLTQHRQAAPLPFSVYAYLQEYCGSIVTSAALTVRTLTCKYSGG
jgi:hypothetical protein